MSHLLALRVEVALVVGVCGDDDRDALDCAFDRFAAAEDYVDLTK